MVATSGTFFSEAVDHASVRQFAAIAAPAGLMFADTSAAWPVVAGECYQAILDESQ